MEYRGALYYYLDTSDPEANLWLVSAATMPGATSTAVVLQGEDRVCACADPGDQAALPKGRLKCPLIVPVPALRRAPTDAAPPEEAAEERRRKPFVRLLPGPEEAKRMVNEFTVVVVAPNGRAPKEPCLPTPLMVVEDAVVRVDDAYGKTASWGVPGQIFAAHRVPVITTGVGDQLVAVVTCQGKVRWMAPQGYVLPTSTDLRFAPERYLEWLIDATQGWIETPVHFGYRKQLLLQLMLRFGALGAQLAESMLGVRLPFDCGAACTIVRRANEKDLCKWGDPLFVKKDDNLEVRLDGGSIAFELLAGTRSLRVYAERIPDPLTTFGRSGTDIVAALTAHQG